MEKQTSQNLPSNLSSSSSHMEEHQLEQHMENIHWPCVVCALYERRFDDFILSSQIHIVIESGITADWTNQTERANEPNHFAHFRLDLWCKWYAMHSIAMIFYFAQRPAKRCFVYAQYICRWLGKENTSECHTNTNRMEWNEWMNGNGIFRNFSQFARWSPCGFTLCVCI